MKPFSYTRPDSIEQALTLLSQGEDTRLLGGGTNLVDLMREEIDTPAHLIDATALKLEEIAELPDRLRIGAGVRNSTLAAHPVLRQRLPVVSQALLSGASGQLRNMATVGGNLLQRSRCSYFYDTHSRCNKRVRGSGCDALEGFHRMGAVLGTSQHCISTHPSDLCVGLIITDAQVRVRSVRGERTIPLREFHTRPEHTPDVESTLAADELIVDIEVPFLPEGMRSRYRKVRDRASYAFALVSVAAAMQVEDGQVTQVRIGFGGIGTVPWRAHAAEEALLGKPATSESFTVAAEAELAAAQPTPQLEFKVPLARRTLVAVLRDLAEPAAHQEEVGA